MVEIPLANGKGIALVDERDAARVQALKWHRHPMGYASAHTPMVNGVRQSVLLHRFVLNAAPGVELDHINHNKLDCRRMNLRTVTRSQNMQNKAGAQRNNRLGVRGVIGYLTHGRREQRYWATVQLGRQNIIRKGGFRTVEEAAAAAAELRRVHFTHSPENA